MDGSLKILFVEDLETDYELALHEIGKIDQAVVSKRVDDREGFVDALRNFKPDVIVSDYVMPAFNGMEALMIKQEICPDTPFIILTGSTNEEIAVECMKAGADDYVLKEHLKKLELSIHNSLKNSLVKSENRKNNQELYRRELLLRNAINNIPSTFTIYNKHGQIEYMNEFGLILANLPIEKVVGKKEEEILPKEITETYLPRLYDVYRTKESQIVECLLNYKDAPRYVIYYFVPTFDEKNDIYKVLGITYDITDRKNSEDQIKEAMEKAEESDRLKSAFLANISHEVRTPLNAIMGFSQMIKANYAHDDQLVSYMDIILNSGNQLLDVIKEMIELSRLVAGELQVENSEFSVDELMNELTANFRSTEDFKIKHGITLVLELPEQTHNHTEIFSDREKTHQVLKNLLGNAFKFTYKGVIKFGYHLQDPETVLFFVSDTGIGIENDKLELIFDRFRQADDSNTRHHGGIGIGLTICRELVKLLGGKIWVESVPGVGSTFSFTLPKEKKTAL
jgi:signal transduction histidine kinase/ActR/RegA family two-component response regulator